jgi:hypothetical protein
VALGASNAPNVALGAWHAPNVALGAPEEFRSLGLPAGDEFGTMFQFSVEGERDFVGARGLDLVRSLNPRLDQDLSVGLSTSRIDCCCMMCHISR